MPEKSAAQAAKKRGRPSMPYDAEIAEEICHRISATRFGLEEICRQLQDVDSKAPGHATVYAWLSSTPEFMEKYSRARLLQADYMADLAVTEAFTSRIGTIEKDTFKGHETTVADNVERSRLIVSTILKRASQLAPKKYGEKVGLTNAAGDGPAEIVIRRVGGSE